MKYKTVKLTEFTYDRICRQGRYGQSFDDIVKGILDDQLKLKAQLKQSKQSELKKRSKPKISDDPEDKQLSELLSPLMTKRKQTKKAKK